MKLAALVALVILSGLSVPVHGQFFLPGDPDGLLRIFYGEGAVGGSGGTVITVTNTNDSGAGSLRAAYNSIAGPSIVNCTPGLTGVLILLTNLHWTKPGRDPLS